MPLSTIFQLYRGSQFYNSGVMSSVVGSSPCHVIPKTKIGLSCSIKEWGQRPVCSDL